MTKLKAFADDKFSVAKMMISVFDRVENIVGTEEKMRVVKSHDCNLRVKRKLVSVSVENILGKGENAFYKYFLLS